MNSLSFLQIHYELTIYFANSLWNHYQFSEFTIYQLSISRIHQESLSISRIHNEFTIYFANSLWTDYLICEFTIFVENILWITRGSLRWLKKSSKEVLSHGDICMRFWDGSTLNWLKIYNHVSKFRDGSLFQIKNSEIAQNLSHLRIFSHLRVSVLKKWAISEFWHVIVDFEPI